MIRVSVLYPRSEGRRFDMAYYLDRHMPLVKEKLAPLGMIRAEVDKGLAGAGGAPSPFYAVAHLCFQDVPAFEAAFGRVGGELLADIPNYTDAEPLLQISDVLEV